jgi:NAD(P)-dependent dehydrogenase (short-subunit alcohol dehydrogenase family)
MWDTPTWTDADLNEPTTMTGPEQPVALVTGASRGIGKVCAVEMARAGFRVAIAARTFAVADQRSLPGNLELTAEVITGLGGTAMPVRMDLDDRQSISTGVDAVLGEWGRIDTLVNNAFYQSRESYRSLVDMRMEHMDKQIRVNLLTPIFLAKLLLPQMLERGSGAVIDLVSGAGVHELETPPGARPWSFGYGTSKTGMIEIAAMLADQFGDRGIRAFSVQPGTVLTEQLTLAVEEGSFTAQEDWSPPEYAALAVAWLATAPEAMDLNGALIHAPTFVAERHLVAP